MTTTKTDALGSAEFQPQLPALAWELLRHADTSRKQGSLLRRVHLTPAEPGVRRASLHADYAATALLRHALGQHRWPGRTLVGDHASRAAFQIALRTHQPSLQLLFLRQLHEAVQRGQATWWQWAHLHDRSAINNRDLQLYGTHYQFESAGPALLPVSAPETLDARRAEVNLPPVAEALDALRQRLHEESDDVDAGLDVVATTAGLTIASAA